MAKQLYVRMTSPEGLYETFWKESKLDVGCLDSVQCHKAPLLAEEAAVERLTSDVSRWGDL